MQHELNKRQGSIEKSVARSTVKIVLGHEGETSDAAGVVSAHTAMVDVPPQQSAAERIAELERDTTAAMDRIAKLEAALADAESKAKVSTDALADLRAGLETAQTDAERRGYSEGQNTAKEELKAELQRGIEAWEQGVQQLAEQHRSHGAELQRQAADIALAATAKVIGERSTDAAQIGAAVEHLIHASGLAGALKIALAPAHFEALMRDGLDVVQRLQALAVELRADSRVAYGGCVMEAAEATVDARYEVQLEKLRRIIAEYAAQDAAQ
jgi:flagellar biosynthesis/type III secretory pathway protein FliH